MKTLYLRSTELREPYKPIACEIVKRLRSEIRDDLALVKVEPMLPSCVYDTQSDVSYLILAARYQGDSLFPINKSSIPVYICQLKSGVPNEEPIVSKNLSILDWGVLE